MSYLTSVLITMNYPIHFFFSVDGQWCTCISEPFGGAAPGGRVRELYSISSPIHIFSRKTHTNTQYWLGLSALVCKLTCR